MILDPPRDYTCGRLNYDQVTGRRDDWTGSVTFAAPTPAVPGTTEAWQLTCEDKKGKVRARRNVVVERGDRVNVGGVCGSGSLRAAKAAG